MAAGRQGSGGGNMFAKRMKELRQAKGLTENALDEILGLMKGTVSKWEQGNTVPEQELFEVIASFFGVRMTYLIGIE